jgi:hypothetical protein
MTRSNRLVSVICLLFLLFFPANPARGNPSQVFYLHKTIFENPFEYLLDQNQPTQYTTPIDLEYLSCCWRTNHIASNVSIEASTWTISLWLGYTVQSTSLHIAIGHIFQGMFYAMVRGNITGIRQFPKEYTLGLATSAFHIQGGGALALELTPVRNTQNSAPNVVLYLDSPATPSQVSVDPAISIPELGISIPMLTLGMALITLILRKKELPILTS